MPDSPSNCDQSSTKTTAGERFLLDAGAELERAMAKWPGMNSAHEAYAVILEELDEFWQEVRRKQTDYDPRAMYGELLQIAAMAARTAVDVVMPMMVPFVCAPGDHQWEPNGDPMGMRYYCPRCTSESMVER